MAGAFTHREGVVHWDGQPLEPAQAVALLAEFQTFADAAFLNFDFDACERHGEVHDQLREACCAANRWAAASA